MNDFGDAELIELLRGVSRSFVLTIRALPRGLRRPVGLAYLLARASDTMSDTAAAPVQVRLESLRAFKGFLARENCDFLANLHDIHPQNPAEQHLLTILPRVIAAVQVLPAPDQAEIGALLAKITRGQELDLLRFPDAAQLRALETSAELDEYTYLVAGCVGEFWTRICSAHLPRYGTLDPDDLCLHGRAFGQGLQLVNILRDLPEDIANGRCYLPMAELREAGISTPEALHSDPRPAAPVFERWRQKAFQYHEQARQYIEAIRPWRVRFACLIPWALGIRTLKLIGEKSPLETRRKLKVGRPEVTRIMRRALWAAVSNGSVRKFERILTSPE